MRYHKERREALSGLAEGINDSDHGDPRFALISIELEVTEKRDIREREPRALHATIEVDIRGRAPGEGDENNRDKKRYINQEGHSNKQRTGQPRGEGGHCQRGGRE